MNRISFFIFTCLACNSAIAWELPGVGEYKFESIGANLYVMHGPFEDPNAEPNVANRGFMNNPGIVVSKNGVILIDPGSSLGVSPINLYWLSLIRTFTVIIGLPTMR